MLNGGSPLITNCILYGDAGGEIVSSTSAAPTVTYCDVQGGFAGTGNISADPLFVNAAGDLHLRPDSPCRGGGTTAAPAYINFAQDSAPRPNPPSIGALEAAAPGTTHILWGNTDGRISLWNYSTASGTYTHREYGPYAGWAAKSVADGPDGRTRILWDNVNGMMDLWSLDSTTGGNSPFTVRTQAGRRTPSLLAWTT